MRALSLRPPSGDPHIGHTGSGSLNTNFGTGEQTNTTQNGGRDNRQIIAKELHYHETRVSHEAQPETPPLPTHTAPFQRDPAFVDRSELNDVQEKLSRPGARVALVGLGGVGKSQLAIEYCYRRRDQEPDTWVLWLHTSSAARFDQDIQKLASDVKISGADDEKADVYQLVYAWLNDRRRSWLIVLDNTDDAEFLFEAPAFTSTASKTRRRIEYLPVCSHGSILITTRRHGIATRLVDQNKIVELRPDQEHSVALLKRKLTHQEDAAEVEQLAAVLEYMPLAIAQASAYINLRWPRCCVGEYLTKLERSDKSKASLLKVDSIELRRDAREARNSILLTWQISFEHIHATRQSAADLLSLMSFYDYQGVPETLVKSATGLSRGEGEANERLDDDHSPEGSVEDSFEIDVDTLRDYSFIMVSPGRLTFELHRLVQLAMQVWLKGKEQYREWQERSLRELDSAFPLAEHAQWKTCQMLYPHAKLLLDSSVNRREAQLCLASISFKAAWFAWSQGLYVEAEAAAKQSRSLRETILGSKDTDTLASMGMLALVLANQGKYEEAEEMNRRALEGSEKVLGKEHPDTLRSVSNLAMVLADQGKYEDAEAMNRRALQGYEKVLGKEHPSTLTSVDNLAGVLRDQGKYEEAEAMNRRALEGYEKVLGKEHPDTLTSVNNLALALQYQGKYKEAEAMNRRALEGYEKVLGKEHPDTLTSVNNLALALQYQGKYKEAEAMNRRALERREKVLGKEHPSTLTSVDNLAGVLRDQGKYEEAEAMNRRALEGYEKVLGKEHPDTLTSVNNLALALQYQGKYKEAEAMNRRALERREKVLGKEHPDMLTSVDNLAGVLRDQGKYEEAEAMNRRALEGREKVLGKEHPNTLTSVSNLATVLRDQGKYEEAEGMNRRALEGKEEVLGKEHPSTLTSVDNLASLLRSQGKYEDAEAMNRRALQGYEKVLGKEHPDTLISAWNLAGLQEERGNFNDAHELYRRAAAGFAKVLGSNHPHTVRCQQELRTLQTSTMTVVQA